MPFLINLNLWASPQKIFSADKVETPTIILSPQDEEALKLVGGFYGLGVWDKEKELREMQDQQKAQAFHIYGTRLTDETLTELISFLDKASIISIDQEGGPINRLVWAEGVTQFNLRMIAELKATNEKKCEYAKKVGELTAKYLKAYGVNLNCGPILDLHTATRNRNISNNDPFIIASLTKAYMEGLQSERVAYCAKHFPDNVTAINTDDHLASSSLPINQLSIDVRYQPLIEGGVPVIMLSNAIFKGKGSCDASNPASLSRPWVDFLRNNLKFDGLIITDAMATGSIAEFTASKNGARSSEMENYEKAITQAYAAGVDLVLGSPRILVSGKYPTAPYVSSILRKAVISGEIPLEQIKKSAQRIRAFSKKFPKNLLLDANSRKNTLSKLEKEAEDLYKEMTGQNVPDLPKEINQPPVDDGKNKTSKEIEITVVGPKDINERLIGGILNDFSDGFGSFRV